jgi:hypothetical protein
MLSVFSKRNEIYTLFIEKKKSSVPRTGKEERFQLSE